MKRSLTLVSVVLITMNAFAVQPQFWKVTTPDDFLAGEIEGMAVTSRGELRQGPTVEKIASFSDPFVLSQTADGSGNRYFGTGNEGKVYALRGSELKVLYTSPEPEIYALEYHSGALYVGSSPNGKVYRVDPQDGKATVFFDPKQAYIWDLAFFENGDLAVATGVEGKLFRVTRNGASSVAFDAPETHIRSIAIGKNERILLGGSGEGRIYEVKGGNGRALFDSQFSEISAIWIDPATGQGWAAGVANVLPASAPPKSDPSKQPASATQGGTAEKKEGEPGTAAAAVDVSFSFDDFSAVTNVVSSGSAELYRIDNDGYVEVARKFDREMIYSITGDGRSIFLSTGPLGRVYELKDNELALVAVVPEKQIVSFSRAADAMLVTTTNNGAVYKIENKTAGKAEYRSSIKDVERFSRFGHFKVEGNGLAESGITVSFRSGNTNTPDETWSAWVGVKGPEGTVSAPPARYLQWKVNVEKPSANTAIDAVTVAFMNRNVAPVIDSVSIGDPGAVFITTNYPASPQVVEATNPDEYGIFTSLDNPRDRNEPGKKFFRKGYRTISWKARDDNGDTLRYALAFRKKGESKWLRLRDNIDETQVNFDTSQLPDGTYEVRLTASDALDNPEMPLTDSKEQLEFVVDNSSPAIAISNSGGDVTIRISDALSAIGKVEYALDAQKWHRLLPVDGIADSRHETFRLKKSDVDGKFVVIRAVDAFYNVATETVRVP